MKIKTPVITAIVTLSLILSVWAQGTTEFFPLSSVKPGMKGVGKTIFQGTAVESFEVEILGVLEKIGPKQSLILGRLSGEEIERYGVFAGMSGSPVYLEGKLVGAVAYAFSFATEPIAGITPIQEMVDVFTEHVGTEFTVRTKVQSFNPLTLFELTQVPRSRFSLDSYLFEVADGLGAFQSHGQLRPIATPVSIAGVDNRVIEQFIPHLNRLGMSPVLGTGSVSGSVWEDTPLQPGSTVAVQLVRGDMDVSASGTVTHINGNKVYAFGHPFLSAGYTSMPFSQAAVVGVIPSLMNSQKMSATTGPVGTITQDRATGIMGLKGESARLIPVKVNLQTSRSEKRNFSYDIVSDTFLSPFLLTFAVHSSITASERSVGGLTLLVKCTISIKGQPQVKFENAISDLASSPALAAVTAAAPVNFILNSGFENVEMQAIEVDISALEETREALLDKVWQDKLEAKPGEEVEITVFLRKDNGQVTSEKYPVKIPEGITPGELKIMIGDGLSMIKNDAQAESAEFIPENLGQLVKAINNLKKNDRLYIRLFREQPGAVVAGQGLPGLPPSIMALYSSHKTSGDTLPINRVVFIEHELPPTDFVLTGQKIIQVEVKG